jgi:hypothetical protein
LTVITIGCCFFMAIQTIKGAEIAGGGMAFIAFGPSTSVCPAVDWEILGIMVKSARFPGCLAVTRGTVGRESCRGMIRRGRIVISRMAAIAGGRRGADISCFVTCGAIGGNGGMGALQGING